MCRVITMLLCLFCGYSYAQLRGTDRIDSMLKEIPRQKEDTNKVVLLDAISYEYCYIDPVQGLQYGGQALDLALKLNWDLGIALANSSIGANYTNRSDFPNALKYEYDALKIYEKLKLPGKEAVMLGNIAIVYRNKMDHVKALEYDSLALKKFEAVHDTVGICRMLSNIGNIYFSNSDFTHALHQFDTALKISIAHGEMQGQGFNLGNIANVYAAMGDPSLALVYYFRTIRLYITMGNKEGLTRNLGNLGEAYLDIARDTTGKIKPDSLIPAGRDANLRKAIVYLDSTVKLCKEIGRMGYLDEYSSALSEAYILAGDYKSAYTTYKLFIAARDSLSTLEKDKEFTRHKLDYEYGKREEKLKYEQQLRDQRYIIGIAALVLLSFVIYRNFRAQKRSNEIISREKKRSDDLLLNILPAEVAEELKEKGSADAKQFDSVTVLFTDFVGFTRVSEQFTPQHLIDELHNCFRAFDEIMGKYKIEKIKTIGDAYLAVCGLPSPIPGHAVHVVNAAKEIHDFMTRRRAELGTGTFQVRIGIHSGSVVAGIVGVKKFAYDIWGDTVNTAARMEQNSAPGRINISHTTYELVKDKFTCEYRGEIEAKNKGMLKMYYVS